jgi:hypothetical protein
MALKSLEMYCNVNISGTSLTVDSVPLKPLKKYALNIKYISFSKIQAFRDKTRIAY